MPKGVYERKGHGNAKNSFWITNGVDNRMIKGKIPDEWKQEGWREGRRSWSKVVPNSIYRHPLYNTFRAMIGRCFDETDPDYEYYGARGITVCDKWRKDFVAFVTDVGNKPEGKTSTGRPLYTLDRYPNPYGNYEPGNTRWATYSQQNSNKRSRKKKDKAA